MDVLVVILAGGIGERLWPLSTTERPKYLLRIDETSLIQSAFQRGLLLCNVSNIFISTIKENSQLIMEKLPMLRKDNIILEPFARNTAAAICLANEVLSNRAGTRPIVFIPSDSVINDLAGFKETLTSAIDFASITNKITVIGVSPKDSSSQYGYIKIGSVVELGEKIFNVDRFVEKPDKTTANSYVKSCKYFWNTGMIIATGYAIRRAIKLHANDIYENIRSHVAGSDYAYGQIKNISFDRAVLEKLDDLLMAIGTFDWEDIGSFEILAKYKIHGLS
ncbi:MAG: hypothetical protein LBB20_00375 [Puniceicoccales bacterium]|jgi:mannose-1-phosphate guanylyltransferase|nr:hypothetical protein [Puniceicoccales bacterium]